MAETLTLPFDAPPAPKPPPEPVDEETALREAQSKLEARRVLDGIPAPTVELAKASALFIERRAEDLDATVARARRGIVPLARVLRSSRLAPVPAPDALDMLAIEAGIPEKLAEMTWGMLATIKGPDGRPVLGGVVSAGGGILIGELAVAELRRRFAAHDKIIIRGATRVAKSVTAAGWLGEEAHALRRSRWVRSTSLADPGAQERAIAARSLVIDDVGYELFGAAEGSGMCAQRCEPFARLMGDLEERRGRRLVITTWLPFERETPRGAPGVCELYGAGVASRMFEGAEVINLVRAEV